MLKGIFFHLEFHLSSEAALNVSDHYPIELRIAFEPLSSASNLIPAGIIPGLLLLWNLG
jgi:hypothetical protein